MTEDPLLRELGHLAKSEDELAKARFDERWDRLAAGTLTAEEEEELRALAGTSPEAHAAYEAFRPLGPDFENRMTDRLAAEVGDGARRDEPRGRLLRFPRALRPATWTAAATAAAAALFLLIRGFLPAAMPMLPAYAAELSGGTQVFRGEDLPSTGPEAFAPGDRFQLVLRPATATSGEDLEAWCFLLRNGDLRRLDARVEIAPGGAVKLEGSFGSAVPAGDWTLWGVVGRRGELPDPTAPVFLTARGDVRERNWVAVPSEIRIHSRSP